MFERDDYEKLRHVMLFAYAPRYTDVWGKAVRTLYHLTTARNVLYQVTADAVPQTKIPFYSK